MRRTLLWASVAVTAAEVAVLSRRRGRLFAAETVVRCRQGHLFTTLWIPGVSLKAVRLGWWRVQRCPVGHHFTVVAPVRKADLTEEERRSAHELRDSRIP